MRYVSVFLLLTLSAASIFAQLNAVEKADSRTGDLIQTPEFPRVQLNAVEKADSSAVTNCFPKAFIIIPSEKIDPFIIVEPAEKNDSKILNEVLCSNESPINKSEENLFPLISPNTNKKP